jgi:hypothetical protein
MVGGYAAERAIIPKLQYRPGTPNEIVKPADRPPLRRLALMQVRWERI